ncbi:MAG: YdcH family protein [Sphingomonadaceae bacterium]
MDSAHILALQAKHSGLEGRIAAETARPWPDSSLVATMKKQKLRIKEALASIRK